MVLFLILTVLLPALVAVHGLDHYLALYIDWKRDTKDSGKL